MNTKGKVKGIIANLVMVEVDGPVSQNEICMIMLGGTGLMAEVIKVGSGMAYVQVFESTRGLKVGAMVQFSGSMLEVSLGPGILSRNYDGLQNDLDKIEGTFLQRGKYTTALDNDRDWEFNPLVSAGDTVEAGSWLGEVQENLISHKIMTPFSLEGICTVKSISPKGSYKVNDEIAVLTDSRGREIPVTMVQKWPVKKPLKCFRNKPRPSGILETGVRSIDTLNPITEGGTGFIPGPFGCGKTVLQHAISKQAEADIVIIAACGERANEVVEIFKEFPELEDTRTGAKLTERTTIIANTSNMPVAARDASVYTGITIAEYYRDMGYDVALMADSTSRLAEAMREISGRLEEMPGEEGYPAYLASRLAEFYERAGRVKLIGSKEKEGSVSVMGAVSPPGGDFSEPVAQNTLRIVKVFWALDADLADRRHFPSINWLKSYSLYLDEISTWWNKEIGDQWLQLRNKAMSLLQKESELQEIVKLVGPDALPPKERATLESARMIREDFLQQNAFHEVDTYCPGKKQYEMLRIMNDYADQIHHAVDHHVHIDNIIKMKSREDIARMATVSNEEFESRFKNIQTQLSKEIESLIKEVN